MIVEVEALELEVQLNTECFVLLIAQALSLLLPSLFLVCALHTTPRSGIDKSDVADLIFEHLLLAKEEHPDEPVVIAENLNVKYLFG